MRLQQDTQKATWVAAVTIAILLWPATSSAFTLLEAIENLNAQLPYFWLIVTSFTKVLGFFFAVLSVLQFRKVGEQRMSMSGSESLAKPLMYAFLAVVFLYIPTMVQMMNVAIYGKAEMFEYGDVVSGVKEEFKVVIDLAGGLIKLIGYISFLRGWILLARVGQQGAQPGGFAKAMMHIIGGLLAINVFGTLYLLGSLVGYY